MPNDSDDEFELGFSLTFIIWCYEDEEVIPEEYAWELIEGLDDEENQ